MFDSGLLRGLLACGVCAVLSSCGGGTGGGAVASGNIEPTTPQGVGAIKPGIYRQEEGINSGLLLVHSDGLLAGRVATFDSNSLRTITGFAGPTTPTASGAVSPKASLVVIKDKVAGNATEPSYTSAVGTAKVSLAQPTAVTVSADVTDATIAAQFQSLSFSADQSAARGLSLQDLGGAYDDGAAFHPYNTNVLLDAGSGSFAGTYVTGCQIDGRLYAFDSANAVFRVDATFSGPGCAGQFYPSPGTGKFLGYVGRNYAGAIYLTIVGVLGDQAVLANFFHK